MKKVILSVRPEGTDLVPGTVVELDDLKAKQLIADGHARLAPDDAEVGYTEPPQPSDEETAAAELAASQRPVPPPSPVADRHARRGPSTPPRSVTK